MLDEEDIKYLEEEEDEIINSCNNNIEYFKLKLQIAYRGGQSLEIDRALTKINEYQIVKEKYYNRKLQRSKYPEVTEN